MADLNSCNSSYDNCGIPRYEYCCPNGCCFSQTPQPPGCPIFPPTCGGGGVTGPTGPTAPSIYAQQGKCRNHAAFSTLKTIKQPL